MVYVHVHKLARAFIHSKSHRSAIFVILAGYSGENINSDLHTHIIYLNMLLLQYAENPKCLILLVTLGESTDLKYFFELLWVNKFLDVTVIEFVQLRYHGNNILFKYPTSVNVMIHYYNPFLGHYWKIVFSPEVDFFPNKLQNLYQYPLKTIFFVNSYKLMRHKNSTNQDIWKRLYGIDINIINTIAKALNFSITVRIPNIQLNDIDQTIKNISNANAYEHLYNDTINFASNIFICPYTSKELGWEQTYPIRIVCKTIIIKQFGISVEVSHNLKNLIQWIISLTVLVLILNRTSKLYGQMWTPFNII